MHPENAIDNGDFIKILVYKFILDKYTIQAIPPVHYTYTFYQRSLINH